MKLKQNHLEGKGKGHKKEDKTKRNKEGKKKNEGEREVRIKHESCTQIKMVFKKKKWTIIFYKLYFEKNVLYLDDKIPHKII